VNMPKQAPPHKNGLGAPTISSPADSVPSQPSAAGDVELSSPPAAFVAGRLLQEECGILVLTGSGIETDPLGLRPFAIEPNISHALAALVACTGGALVTTNITDAALLSMPIEHRHVAFTAPHGTMCDQKDLTRGAKCRRRRPRCHRDLGLALLSGRGVFTEIPVTVGDDDPNLVETRKAAAAPHLTTLLIMGNSIIKSSNGRALNFLSEMCAVQRVVFVNPDSSRVPTRIKTELQLWGLPGDFDVQCVHQTATAFAEEVLSLHRLRERCEGWVAIEEVGRIISVHSHFCMVPIFQ